ncbi:RNA-directed DNA polymerase, eukaryota [Tanacetum coccineum]
MAYWEVLKFDFFECIKNSESSEKLASGCNPSFIVLIPKIIDPLGFLDYRPISLIGCVYKVISKVLSLRLAKVIPTIIGPNQTAFLAGRQILDGSLIANEIIRMAKIENHDLLLFKVDFEKAFDSVCWKFLQDIMIQMGFGGLRQGDPLSPFLFLLVTEALQVSIIEACNKGLFKGVYLAEDGSKESLLQCADDALFFGKWSRSNARNLILILKCFEEASGLKVNLSRSRIFGVGVGLDEVEAMASSLNYSHDNLSFMYLGLPVGKSMNFYDGWSEVVNRIRNRLSDWKARSLLIGGRLTLIKSILGSIPIYFLSLFKAPLKVINILESFRRHFFWGFKEDQRGISWVKWDSILLSPKLGGLGVDGAFSSPLGSISGQGIWWDIIKADRTIDSKDDWYPDCSRLMDLYPRLFALDTFQDCKVSDRWVFVDGSWKGMWLWRIRPRGRDLDDFASLISHIGNFLLSDGVDKWVWKDDVSGIFKANWEVLKFDFFECIKNSESSGKLASRCNPSFIVLIPKIIDPLGFLDYRPISLIGCVYKVISKVLSLRLAKVIPTIIGPNQTAFLAGRQIPDGSLIANEIIRMAKIENHDLLLFKVDFEKAFDIVSLISVLINGSPSIEFKMERGLRQGDPLSPFLFLLVAEALQVSIIEACNKGLFKGVYLAEDGSNVSLLQCADDALFFRKWSRSNARNLILILKCFEEASGLNFNLSRSRIFGVGVGLDEVEAMASSLNYSHDNLPFMYLSFPVGKSMNFYDGWSEVVNRIRNRISAWKSRSLLIGGCLTLIKSVLGSIPIYFLFLFKAPLKVINIRESFRRRFFWGFKEDQRGISWVKWDSILLSPKLGGLGVGSLLAKNLALLGKWRWRFLTEKDALWQKLICSLYDADGAFSSPLGSICGQGIWWYIIKADRTIDSKDAWCPDYSRLMDLYPWLFVLDTFQDFKVSDRWVFVDGSWKCMWSWRIPPKERALDDLASLISHIGNFLLFDGVDKWVWKDDVSGIFKVNFVTERIQNCLFPNSSLGLHDF